jgi:hypothetical protein
MGLLESTQWYGWQVDWGQVHDDAKPNEVVGTPLIGNGQDLVGQIDIS